MGAPYREPARESPGEPPRTWGVLILSLLPGLVLMAVGLGARMTLRYPGSLWEQGVFVAVVAVVYVAVIRMHLKGAGGRH
ncbi:MAG TPA: hypothetical protein VGL81_35260 [Polyangiaceae bacterium]|jgi:membrane protein implicated in regulation of membrane protease activity